MFEVILTCNLLLLKNANLPVKMVLDFHSKGKSSKFLGIHRYLNKYSMMTFQIVRSNLEDFKHCTIIDVQSPSCWGDIYEQSLNNFQLLLRFRFCFLFRTINLRSLRQGKRSLAEKRERGGILRVRTRNFFLFCWRNLWPGKRSRHSNKLEFWKIEEKYEENE